MWKSAAVCPSARSGSARLRSLRLIAPLLLLMLLLPSLVSPAPASGDPTGDPTGDTGPAGPWDALRPLVGERDRRDDEDERGPRVGACCFDDGTCAGKLTEPECCADGGAWTGADVSCVDAACAAIASAFPWMRFDQPGSLLIFPHVEVRWNQAGTQVTGDTIIQVANDFGASVYLRTLLVRGSPSSEGGGAWAHAVDGGLLTANQPAWWSAERGSAGPIQILPFAALDGVPAGVPDPDTGERVLSGALFVWAVDETGRPIRWNHLFGYATIVRHLSGDAVTVLPASFRAVAGADDGSAIGPPDALPLDGTTYDAAPRVLLFDGPAEGSSALSTTSSLVTTSTSLTLLALRLDLRPAVPEPAKASAVLSVWNENEVKFCGVTTCVTCWWHGPLGTDGAGIGTVADYQTDWIRMRVEARHDARCAPGGSAPLLAAAFRRVCFEPAPMRTRSAIPIIADGMAGLIGISPVGFTSPPDPEPDPPPDE